MPTSKKKKMFAAFIADYILKVIKTYKTIKKDEYRKRKMFTKEDIVKSQQTDGTTHYY